MIPFQLIPNTASITEISYYPEFSVICSIGKAPFHGTIEITYQPKNTLLEFESFESWLRTLANQSFTIEELTRLVFDNLLAGLGDIPLRVTILASTTVHSPAKATILQGYKL